MRLPHLQVVQIPPQGVDLTVVGQVAEGMGQAPGGEGIRAVALVDESQRRLEMLIRQILVKTVNLRAEEQPLVHDAPAGAAAHVAAFHAPLHLPAHHEQLAFKLRLVRKTAAVDEQLADQGTGALGVLPDAVPVDRHLPPGSHPAAVFRHGGFQLLFMAAAAEHHRHAVPAARGKLVGKGETEKLIRQGQHNTRAVASFRIAPHRAAVHQPLENGDSHLNNPVAGFVLQVRH